MVSRDLFSEVSSLEIQPFKPCISRDHSALVLHMHSPQVTLHPLAVRCSSSLCLARSTTGMLLPWPTMHIASSLCLKLGSSQVSRLLRHTHSARTYCVVRPGRLRAQTEVIAARRGDQPWFDADCHAAKATLQQACVQVHDNRGGW